jgi:hypothetical protein
MVRKMFNSCEKPLYAQFRACWQAILAPEPVRAFFSLPQTQPDQNPSTCQTVY